MGQQQSSEDQIKSVVTQGNNIPSDFIFETSIAGNSQQIGTGEARKELEIGHITLPDSRDEGKLCQYIHNLYTPDECKEYLRLSESCGYITAAVNVGGGREVVMQDYRNSQRCIIDDKRLADELYLRLRPHLPEFYKDCEMSGVNERFRFLKYTPGDFFAPHMDGCYCRPDYSEHSKMTVMLYLSEVTSGGETRFLHSSSDDIHVDFVPRQGSVLIFDHRILHEGRPIVEGVKYAIRSDVMFRRNDE
eukprot:TRINITY_DN3118_c0_g1_i5.p1 TRINITY_DN3118_c0_g1~~TRINITY_DN3118_c0_g1_i5.p1  ORF type:complete len:247 (+),score=48.60 TRINITY_DN3118_c0_g1_i5:127-867(+)